MSVVSKFWTSIASRKTSAYHFSVFMLEGRSPEMNVGHVIANSRTIRDLGESSFDSAICIRTVKLKSC